MRKNDINSEKIAAVISSFNRGAKIKPTIDSLLDQSVSIGKIVVVDDGSEDGKKVPVFKNKLVEQIFLEKNVGAVWGRNLALSKCSGFKYVLIIDDDITLDKKCVESLLSTFKTHKDCVASMPTVYFLKSKQKVWSSGSGVDLLTGKTIFHTTALETQEKEISAATSVLLTKISDIKEAGWYDPLFYFCYEDADFYYRLRTKTHKKIYNVRDAHAYHDIPLHLSIERVSRRSYHIARGRVIFLYRYGHNFLVNLFFVMFFFLYYAYIGLKHKDYFSGLRYLRGFLDGLAVVALGRPRDLKSTEYKQDLSLDDIQKVKYLKGYKVRL